MSSAAFSPTSTRATRWISFTRGTPSTTYPTSGKAVALGRIAAILRPGGIFYLRDLIFSCALSETSQVVEAWLAGASASPESGWTRAELETHLREEYSTFSWLLEPMLEQAGFTIQQAQHGATRVHSAYTCVKVG